MHLGRIYLSHSESNFEIRNHLQKIVNTSDNWSILVKDKDLAQLGDSITNLVYSFAMTFNKGKCIGLKAPDSILANAFHSSTIKEIFPLRGKKNQIGDIVEAILLLSWLKAIMSLDEMVRILFFKMKESINLDRREEVITNTNAFKHLLNEIACRLSDEC